MWVLLHVAVNNEKQVFYSSARIFLTIFMVRDAGGD